MEVPNIMHQKRYAPCAEGSLELIILITFCNSACSFPGGGGGTLGNAARFIAAKEVGGDFYDFLTNLFL